MTIGEFLELIRDAVDDFENDVQGDHLTLDDDLEESPTDLLDRLVVKLRKEVDDVS